VDHDQPVGSALVVFGAALRSGRVGAGLTQRRLAELTGVDQSRISRLERGQIPGMRVDRVAQIVVVLGLHLDCRPARRGRRRRVQSPS
jgi:transcriptional regulator with XRE-family HTH domain